MVASRGQLAPILDDESLFQGLEDDDAKFLVSWLVDWVEKSLDGCGDSIQIDQLIRKGWERGRAVRKVFLLWNNPISRKSALQLAATEKLIDLLPDINQDPDLWLEITLANLEKEMDGWLEAQIPFA